MVIKNKIVFYLLSCTWGIIMTLIGSITALVLLILGNKPKRHGYCWYFEIGEGWGGINLGIFFVVSKGAGSHTKNHEHGHGFQNAVLGPLFPFIVAIPSVVRYWYREFKYHRNGLIPPTDYDDIWFERQATKLGNEFMATFEQK